MANSSKATRRILWIIGGLVILLVILGIVAGATGLLGGNDEGERVETADAEVRRLTQLVTASGRVQPEVEVKISSDVSGEIITLTVKEGDHVQQGQLLARVRPDFYAAQVEQAQADVLQARAQQAQRRADLLRAENDMKRQQQLFQQKAISEQGYEQARNQYEVAKAAHEASEYAVQSVQARLREANEQLGKTAIYAPMSGTVSKLDVEPGERVVGTSQMTGTEMMRIARLDQMELEVDVNENDVVNVTVGDTASVEVDAYPEQRFRGVVTEIANSARVVGGGTQDQVTNFPVKVRIVDLHNLGAGGGGETLASGEEVPGRPEVAPRFRPGMSGTVDIFTQTIGNAVAIPIQAVTVRDFNKVKQKKATAEADADAAVAEEAAPKAAEEDLRKVVFIVADGEAQMVEVVTGISDETHIEVRSGLSGGEKVIIGPYRAVSRTLEPGDKVRAEDGLARMPDPVASR